MQRQSSSPRSLGRLLGSAAVIMTALFASTAVQAQSCFPNQPLSTLLITSNFGIRKHPKLAGVTRLHGGSDLRAAIGTPIYAVEDGMVTIAGNNPSAGNWIHLLGADGKVMVYMHNTRLFVARGDTVKRGQQIAESGNTGEASAAPHLHFEVKLNGGKHTDPRPYLCNPNEKPGAGPDPTLNPGAPAIGTQGATPTTNGVPNNNYPPMGPTPNTATSVPQASVLGDYAGMSTREFLAAESSRRFGNPQWVRDIRDPLDVLRNHPDPAVKAEAESTPPGDPLPMLAREIAFMQNLKNFYRLENHERKERMEHMLATDLADRVNEYSSRVLQQIRSQATQSLK